MLEQTKRRLERTPASRWWRRRWGTGTATLLQNRTATESEGAGGADAEADEGIAASARLGRLQRKPLPKASLQLPPAIFRR